MAHARKWIRQGMCAGACAAIGAFAWTSAALDTPAASANSSGGLLELPGSGPSLPAAMPPVAPTAAPVAPLTPFVSTPIPPSVPSIPSPAAAQAASPAIPVPVLTNPPAAAMPPQTATVPASSPPATAVQVAPTVAPGQTPAAAPPPVQPPESAAQIKRVQDVAVKNPDLILEPLHTGNMSLMFSESDMNVLLQALDVYDSTSRAQKVETGTGKDDLNSLLDSLKAHGDAPVAEAPPALPNLYLGSIVYYTPSHWSVWINGKKLINSRNAPTNEFHITRLSPSEVELVWKPPSLNDMPALWQQLTNNGAHPLSHVMLDEAKGTVTLQMHTNQTFLPKSLAIREGLIKSSPVPVSDAPLSESAKPFALAPAEPPVSFHLNKFK